MARGVDGRVEGKDVVITPDPPLPVKYETDNDVELLPITPSNGGVHVSRAPDKD